jgi:hypothetical protein
MPSALETKSMTGEVNGMTISPCPKVTLLISLVVLPARAQELQHLLLKFFWARLTLSFFFRLQRVIERSFSVGTQWARSSANGRTDHSAERGFLWLP